MFKQKLNGASAIQNTKGEIIFPWNIPLLIDTIPITDGPALRTVLQVAIDFSKNLTMVGDTL